MFTPPEFQLEETHEAWEKYIVNNPYNINFQDYREYGVPLKRFAWWGEFIPETVIVFHQKANLLSGRKDTSMDGFINNYSFHLNIYDGRVYLGVNPFGKKYRPFPKLQTIGLWYTKWSFPNRLHDFHPEDDVSLLKILMISLRRLENTYKKYYVMYSPATYNETTGWEVSQLERKVAQVDASEPWEAKELTFSQQGLKHLYPGKITDEVKQDLMVKQSMEIVTVEDINPLVKPAEVFKFTPYPYLLS